MLRYRSYGKDEKGAGELQAYGTRLLCLRVTGAVALAPSGRCGFRSEWLFYCFSLAVVLVFSSFQISTLHVLIILLHFISHSSEWNTCTLLRGARRRSTLVLISI